MPTNEKLRIVSLLPSATEIVCALGLEDSLVGITHECDFPPKVLKHKPTLTASRISHETMTSAEIDHAVRAQLDGHGSIYNLDEEKLRELQRDLILTQELCDVCAVSYKEMREAAARINNEGEIKVVSLEPNTIKDIFANIRTVGELTDKKQRAEEFIAQLESRLNAVVLGLSEIENYPRVLMLEWLEPFFAPGHWVPEQVALAGGEHSFGRLGQTSVVTTIEKIAAYDPEIIVLIPCGYYKEDTVRALSSVNWPDGWRELTAVKNGEVWAVDASAYFSRPGPHVVDGVEILARIFHPEVYGEPSESEAIRVTT